MQPISITPPTHSLSPRGPAARWHTLLLFFLLATAALLPAFAPSGAYAANRKNVLYLNSYHNGYSWSDQIQEGIRTTLADSPFNVVLQIEYMDSKKFYYKDTEQTLFHLYRDKFDKTDFDAIIVSDNAALEFMQLYRDDLFPGVPVIFCGVNDMAAKDFAGQNLTGVLENYDVTANIDLALRLNPALKRMVIISDETITGAAIRNQVMAQVAPLRSKLQIEEWNEYTLDNLLENVRSQKADTFFYFVPIYRDIGGQFYSAEELLAQVRANSRTLLLSNWQFLLGHGILGGKLLSGKEHGEAAARMALRVLQGEKPNNIPLQDRSEERYQFDYNELQRLRIPATALPPGSTIINEPKAFYELDKQVFWTIMVSLVLLSATLVQLMRNILARKRVEVALKDQLSYLRLLTDTIPLPLYSKDAEGRLQECNTAFERFFKVSRSTILGQGEASFTGPALDVLRDATDAALLRKPGMITYESTLPGPDGTARDLILHKATYRNARGAIAGLVGVVVDYTDRKRAEDSLRAAEEKYRSIFENSPLGIFRIGPDGSIMDVNPALARMAGHGDPASLRSAGSAPGSLLFSGLDLDNVGSGTNGASIHTLEAVVDRPDGSHATVTLVLRVLRYDDGTVRMVEGYAEDITQRKEAERALSASQRMLRLVLDNIPQLVYWTDRELRFLGANRSFLTFFENDETADIRGLEFEDIVTDASVIETVREANQAVIETGQPRYQSRLTITSPAGSTVWLETNRVPLIGEQGEVVGLLTTAEDVTQRIHLERQLLQSQKMEAIGTLAGGISHDFNNILTSIINSIELAIGDIAADSITFTDLMRALRAAQRGSRLVKQILTFSRPSVEGVTLTDLNEVVTEALVLIKASLPRNIEIRTALPPDPSVTRADPTQIHQVIMNLCTNSFQALRDTGGILELNLEQELLNTEDASTLGMEPGCVLRLSVGDNGPGIPSDITDKIFDPFFTTKGKTEGTGLGLAVVHGIVKGHRGAIRVASVPHKRTVFEIFLPMLGPDSQAMCTGDPLLAVTDHAGHGRILFVEDDDDQLHTIPRVLEGLGYTVRFFKNPMKALQAIHDNPEGYDLVLTDFDMPEANGLELARKIGDIIPSMPIILVSGRDIAATADNIKAMIQKPYNRNILAATLRRVLVRPGTA